MKVSIIIPFVEMNTYTIECVSHCLELDYTDFEIILLPDSTIELPKALINDKIKIIETGGRNIASKRNIGIKNAEGDFYAFIDSDAYPTANWLKHAVNKFSDAPDIWAVGGPNITPPNDPAYKKCVGSALKSFLVSGGNSFRKKIAYSRYCNDLPSCNLIVIKEAMDRLEGFNENMFTGEDVELCRRIINEGKKIYYDNKVIVYHHNRALFKPFFLQRVTYGSTVFVSLQEDTFKKDFSFQTISFLMPMFFVLFMFIGGIISFFSGAFLLFYSLILLSYLMIVLVDTFRYSDSAYEMPLTFISLLIGNISPGFGSLTALLGLKRDLKKIYSNYDDSGKDTL